MTDRKPYYDSALSWATDRQARDSRVLRLAWAIAGIAAAIAIFEAVALALLTPLKTVQPITLLVDRQTGYVQALDPLKPRKIGADAALTQSFLAQYILAREGFDRATVSADYRRVALWSAGIARTQYLALMPASNPESPFQRFSNGGGVTVRVKSVSALNEGTALVRFDTQMQDRSGRAGPVQPWISVVRYTYLSAPMSFEDRLVNPLGFQVIRYRRDPEAAPAPAPSPAAAQLRNALAPIGAALPERDRSEPAMSKQAVSHVVTASLGPATLLRRGIPSNAIPFGSPLAPPSAETASAAGGAP